MIDYRMKMELFIESLLKEWLEGRHDHVKYVLWFQRKENMAYLILRLYQRLQEVAKDETGAGLNYHEPEKFMEFIKSKVDFGALVRIDRTEGLPKY